jgi:hypothetical protein
MSFTPETFYQHIHDAWDDNASMNDVYHLILEWFETYRPEYKYPKLESLVQQWLRDAEKGVDTNELVETFLFGKEYRPIHEAFKYAERDGSDESDESDESDDE